MDPVAETFIIFRGESRRTLRSAKVIALVCLYALFSLLAFGVFVAITRGIEAQVQAKLGEGPSPEQLQAMKDQLQHGLLGYLFNDNEDLIKMLEGIPLVILLVFKAGLYFLPLYVTLMGFDQISGELGNRALRYVTVRARRGSILMGKFSAQMVVLLGLVVLIQVGVLLYGKLSHPDFSWPHAAETGLRLIVASTVYCLAYVALTSLCSALFRSPAVSLIGNIFALFLFWLINLVGSGMHAKAMFEGQKDGPLAYLRYLTPSNYQGNLIHPHLGPFFASAGAYAVFAAIFLGLAYLSLSRRDV